MARTFLILSLAWSAFVADVDRAAADDANAQQVFVTMADGRKAAGVVDQRTDDQTLWLRQTGDGIVLTTAFAWSDLASATLEGVAVDPEALRQRRDKLATADPQPLYAAAAGRSATPAPPLAIDHAAPRSRVRMRNLEIVDSLLVNLDRDVEPDGLQVAVAAIGQDGWPMAVAGELTAELVGERRPWRVAEVDYGPLDRWSQPVKLADFVDGAATYVLPFRHTAPEWRFDVLPDAILSVRLGAVGHGNFAASAPVVIRPLNPMRDNRQLLDKTRFMPGELRGRNSRNTLAPEDGLWLHWTR